jgi:rubrerythrin
MAKLVIKLGALEDLVSQLKNAAMGGYEDDADEKMEYGKSTREPKMERKEEADDSQAYSMWRCEQCGSEVKCTMPKQMMNCPCCNGAVMKKVSSTPKSSVVEED